MNYEQAQRILDRATEGWEFSEFVILRALELTGDYEPDRSPRVDSPLQDKSERTWESQSLDVVAPYARGHC
jgi:hypothetical protein